MNIRSFNEYEKYINGEEKDIVNKVYILINDEANYKSPFSKIESLNEASNMPVLICNDFRITRLNESNNYTVYNSFNFRKGYNHLNKYVGESFIPKVVKNRNNVKRLKFPIIATGKNGSNTYNSLYKFKKSENSYDKFQEKINPKTRYKILMFNNDLVSVHENINNQNFEVVPSKKLSRAIKHINNKVSEGHKFDAYCLTIYESDLGKYYLKSINKCNSLDEKQSYQLYIKIYEHHYGYNIPTWFKNKVRSINVNN
tara:strand:- start:3744 stop:4511 length:768 start_codon:yes stop_codon:yes gene_type:complete